MNEENDKSIDDLPINESDEIDIQSSQSSSVIFESQDTLNDIKKLNNELQESFDDEVVSETKNDNNETQQRFNDDDPTEAVWGGELNYILT
jgi:hypothetical protein